MRELVLNDTFRIAEIFKKTGIRQDLAKILQDYKGKPQDDMGNEVFLLLLERWHMAEKEIVTWLASLLEKEPSQVEKMKFNEIKETINELLGSEELKKLFTSAMKQ